MNTVARSRKAAWAAMLLASSLVLAACGGEDGESDEQQSKASSPQVKKPLALTYDGGIYVLDGESLKVAKDIKLGGYNRVNPAGDDSHIMVSTAEGFRVLDAAGRKMTGIQFKGAEPGHVVRHHGKTVLFSDGTGEVTVFDPKDLSGGQPEAETYTSAEPHHGVAIKLENGELVTTLGTAEKRQGIMVLNGKHKEMTRNEKCPEVHGEATAKDEAVVVGCEDGALVYKDGKITKVASPTEYGRIGNQKGSDKSPVVLGDYKQDADAELERPEHVALVDTTAKKLKLVDLGTSYTFKSLARGPEGEALVLGTDGRIHVIDPDAGKVVDTFPVLDKWTEPMDWQQPRPELVVRGGTAYVTDPEKKKIYALDVTTGKKKATGTLPRKPNELAGADAS